ncbi:MAG: hypothetical protein RR357_02380 [Clostridia bacterium]
MADVKMTQGDKYALRIFFFSALPLVKVIAENDPKFVKKFKGKNFVFQVSVLDEGFKKSGKLATHFVVEDGKWTTHVCEAHANPDIELEFSTVQKFILFFTGKGMPLPKLKGVLKHFGKFVAILLTLLRMAGLLQATEVPTDPYDQELLVQLYFYLLTTGVSQLNRVDHPDVKNFTADSPDRVYAFAVTGFDNLQAWLRVRKGETVSGRGACKRCTPFLCMRFDSPKHALEILMSKAEMIPYMTQGFLSIEGAPEFGAALSNLLFTVAFYAQGTYLDQQK